MKNIELCEMLIYVKSSIVVASPYFRRGTHRFIQWTDTALKHITIYLAFSTYQRSAERASASVLLFLQHYLGKNTREENVIKEHFR